MSSVDLGSNYLPYSHLAELIDKNLNLQLLVRGGENKVSCLTMSFSEVQITLLSAHCNNIISKVLSDCKEDE